MDCYSSGNVKESIEQAVSSSSSRLLHVEPGRRAPAPARRPRPSATLPPPQHIKLLYRYLFPRLYPFFYPFASSQDSSTSMFIDLESKNITLPWDDSRSSHSAARFRGVRCPARSDLSSISPATRKTKMRIEAQAQERTPPPSPDASILHWTFS